MRAMTLGSKKSKGSQWKSDMQYNLSDNAPVHSSGPDGQGRDSRRKMEGPASGYL